MALIQVSGIVSFTAVLNRVLVFSVPAGQNFRIQYISLAMEAAIAAGSFAELREETTAPALVNKILTLSPVFSGMATAVKYTAQGGNNINAFLSVAAVIMMQYTVVGEVI